MSDTGVGDDNRTAVSDEEVEAAARVFFAQTQYTGPRASKASCDIAREMLEAAAAARRDVPGGREDPDAVGAVTPGWRVGRKVGRTIYLDDRLVGVMDTPALADEVVSALASTWLASHPLERADSERNA